MSSQNIEINNPYFIKNVKVESLVGGSDIYWELNEDVNVLVGANGTGKSTLIALIKCILAGPENLKPDELKSIRGKFSSASVSLKNGQEGALKCDSHGETYRELLKALNQMLIEAPDKVNDKLVKIDKLNKTGSSELTKEQIKSIFESISSDVDSKSPVITATSNFLNKGGKSSIEQHLNVEMISTFDMLLLSKEEYDKFNDKSYSQLDFLIENEIRELTQKLLATSKAVSVAYKNSTGKKSLEAIQSAKLSSFNKFLKEVNKLFNPNDKSFRLDDKTGEFYATYKGQRLSMSDLSSGEKQMLMILLKAVNSSDKPTILLMDEPEISLHLYWQETLLKTVRRINDKCQIIVVSHSPALVMKGWLSKMVEIKDISI